METMWHCAEMYEDSLENPQIEDTLKLWRRYTWPVPQQSHSWRPYVNIDCNTLSRFSSAKAGSNNFLILRSEGNFFFLPPTECKGVDGEQVLAP